MFLSENFKTLTFAWQIFLIPVIMHNYFSHFNCSVIYLEAEPILLLPVFLLHFELIISILMEFRHMTKRNNELFNSSVVDIQYYLSFSYTT